ncbi:MAG: extracellular solute-binding protein [Microthrixaceae bacterium]
MRFTQYSFLLRPAASVAVMLALGAALASCSNDSDDGDSGGNTESVTLYSGRNLSLVGPLIDQFTEDTGIQVEVRDGGSAELASQILTEGDASPADVFLSQDAGALGAVSKAGLFSVLPDSVLEKVPAGFRAADGTWVGVSGRARTFVYNPDLLATPPDGIDDLLEDSYDQQIGFAPSNASFQAFVTGLRVIRGDDAAREWLEAFAAQDPVAYENNIAVRDAVEAGEVQVGLVNHYYLYELIEELGTDGVVARNQFVGGGDPGGLINVAGVGILDSTDVPDEALAFVEYLVGPEGQQYFASETFEYPLVSGIEAYAELPALETLDPPAVDLSDLDSLERTQELLGETGLRTKGPRSLSGFLAAAAATERPCRCSPLQQSPPSWRCCPCGTWRTRRSNRAWLPCGTRLHRRRPWNCWAEAWRSW